MPIAIKKKTIYTLDVKIPSLGVDKEVETDDDGLRTMYGEVKILFDALADSIGAVNLPSYSTPLNGSVPKTKIPTSKFNPSPATMEKLMEYARTHADFTIKCASESLNISANTLYQAAVKLIETDALTRQQVLGGMAYIYMLSPKQKAVEKQRTQVPALEVALPEGKVPFPTHNKYSIEREKMESLK